MLQLCTKFVTTFDSLLKPCNADIVRRKLLDVNTQRVKLTWLMLSEDSGSKTNLAHGLLYTESSLLHTQENSP